MAVVSEPSSFPLFREWWRKSPVTSVLLLQLSLLHLSSPSGCEGVLSLAYFLSPHCASQSIFSSIYLNSWGMSVVTKWQGRMTRLLKCRCDEFELAIQFIAPFNYSLFVKVHLFTEWLLWSVMTSHCLLRPSHFWAGVRWWSWCSLLNFYANTHHATCFFPEPGSSCK